MKYLTVKIIQNYSDTLYFDKSKTSYHSQQVETTSHCEINCAYIDIVNIETTLQIIELNYKEFLKRFNDTEQTQCSIDIVIHDIDSLTLYYRNSYFKFFDRVDRYHKVNKNREQKIFKDTTILDKTSFIDDIKYRLSEFINDVATKDNIEENLLETLTK